MLLQSAFPKTASRQKFICRAFASSGNRPARRAASRVWARRREKTASGKSLHNYFRDYDPSTGRYVQSDPIGLAGGIGTYPYAYGNSLRYVDPDGKLGLAECIAVALIAYGAYKLWDKYSCQRECQLGCALKYGCASGNCPSDDGNTRDLTSCKSGCVVQCWAGPGKKGPMGPTPTSPPNNPPITR